MKNLTVSIDDELYQEARMKAAERRTSISALFKTFLIHFVRDEDAETKFRRLASEEQELRAELRTRRRFGLNPDHHLSRDELHDRNALR